MNWDKFILVYSIFLYKEYTAFYFLFLFLDFAIRHYGGTTLGSKLYNLEKVNLKKSLASLIHEINKQAKLTEAYLTEEAE